MKVNFGFTGYSNHNYVCKKHKYNRRGPGNCPVCRENLVCIGSRHRISKNGVFDRIERKTRKFSGQQFPFGKGPKSLAGLKYQELMKKYKGLP